MTATRLAVTACAMLLTSSLAARAQTTPAGVPDRTRVAPLDYFGDKQPVMDNSIFTHLLVEQLEGRFNGSNQQFKYDLQGWSGTDYNKLWIKSEGLVRPGGRFTDAQHEFLYDRAISTYFDLQGGVRVDLDNDVTRTWAAFGIQGLAVYFFDVEATGYVSDQGRFAARFKASYDLLITNRLILQPEAELNVYSKADPARGVGSGLSDIDAGLRLRYELSRKFAPYIGVSYVGTFGQAQRFSNQQGVPSQDVRFVFGVRTWF